MIAAKSGSCVLPTWGYKHDQKNKNPPRFSRFPSFFPFVLECGIRHWIACSLESFKLLDGIAGCSQLHQSPAQPILCQHNTGSTPMR